jgi:hypothetical protein
MEPKGLLLCYQSQPLAPVLSQINPVHASHPICVRCSLILSSCPCLHFPSGVFKFVKFHEGFVLDALGETVPSAARRVLAHQAACMLPPFAL